MRLGAEALPWRWYSDGCSNAHLPRPPGPPQSKRAASADGSDIPAIPITGRQLEAVIRISESLAKMNLQVGGWVG